MRFSVSYSFFRITHVGKLWGWLPATGLPEKQGTGPGPEFTTSLRDPRSAPYRQNRVDQVAYIMFAEMCAQKSGAHDHRLG